jgi:hypothetical protein
MTPKANHRLFVTASVAFCADIVRCAVEPTIARPPRVWRARLRGLPARQLMLIGQQLLAPSAVARVVGLAQKLPRVVVEALQPIALGKRHCFLHAYRVVLGNRRVTFGNHAPAGVRCRREANRLRYSRGRQNTAACDRDAFCWGMILLTAA